jgi:hypothetical protein
MRSTQGKWEEALSAHAASKTLGEGAHLSATYVAIEKVLGLPTGSTTLIITIRLLLPSVILVQLLRRNAAWDRFLHMPSKNLTQRIGYTLVTSN